MNWIALGAIAETVGVIAIFVSVIYVAVQIRQNTREISRSIEETRLAAFERNITSGNRAREMLILNPDLSEVFLTGLRKYQNLNPSEKFRFGMLLRNLFSELQGAYVRQLSVEHDPLSFEGTAGVVDDLIRNAGVREWLAKNAPDWRPEFREFVEQRLARFNDQAVQT